MSYPSAPGSSSLFSLRAASARAKPSSRDPSPAAPLDVPAALRGAPLRILFVASEAAPYFKAGGVADVIGALPRALSRLGHDVRVILPRYKVIDPERWSLSTVMVGLAAPMSEGTELVNVLETEQRGVRVSFIDAPHYFQRDQLYGYDDDGERFILFCRAALEYVRAQDWSPDVLHCHDWHTAIIPNWAKTLYQDDRHFAHAATVYTIHNLAYHGIFGYRILEVAGVAEEGFVYPELPEFAEIVDMMGRGVLYADVVSTVSPRYAREILTPDFGERLDPLLRDREGRLYGILNGVDTEEFDPARDTSLAATFDAFSLERRPRNKEALQEQLKLSVEETTPVLAWTGRLSVQKGFELFRDIATSLVELGAQLVVMGAGDQRYHQDLIELAKRYPDRVSAHLTFSDELARAIYAGSDMLLMPSRFEPCGTSQMIAMRYGCVPIVHRTGGLADTVTEFDAATGAGNGFSFEEQNTFHFLAAIVRALEMYKRPEHWRTLMQNGMSADHSWDASAEQYVALYRRALELQRLTAGRPSSRRARAR
jgi:starch synthase